MNLHKYVDGAGVKDGSNHLKLVLFRVTPNGTSDVERIAALADEAVFALVDTRMFE